MTSSSSSDFLKKMKNSLDNGEFNSEVAGKFNEILELSMKKNKDMNVKQLSETLNKRVEEVGYKPPVSEEEYEKSKAMFEESMRLIEQEELINKIHAEIINKYNKLLGIVEELADDIKAIESNDTFDESIMKSESMKNLQTTISKIKESLT
jgi:preprotein translocase subunit SecD